jgi:pteridine reductase
MNTGSRLAGQTALITGAARRVGAQLVRALHAEGANLAIHCHRSLEAAESLAAELNAVRPASAEVLGADLRDASQPERLVAQTCERFGGLNLLINNASSFYPTPLGSITLSQWQDLMGTNLQAPLFMAQAAAPPLKASRGAIINIVDIHGLRPLLDHTVYSTAKAGLIMLTRALARELAPEVRVNAVAPGAVLWPEAGMDEQRKEKILEQTPLHRPGSPADIARAVLFFAADSPFVTGQILAVDGGRSVGW